MKTRATLFSKASLRVLSLAMALGITPALYAQTVTLSGTVYLDANGLTDGAINGTASGTVTVGILPPRQIYVYLFQTIGIAPNAFQLVVGKTLVNTAAGSTRGQYTIPATSGENYTLQISSVNADVGDANPVVGFNTAVGPTGEGTTATGTGTGDGQPNYSVGINTTSDLTVNFGIEIRPVGNDYSVSNPAYITGASPQLDSLLVPAAAFTAADQEDGTYPAGLTGRTVHLLQATGGRLYYNGRLITASILSPASRIQNFTADSIRFVRNVNEQVFSFPFSSVDNANVDQAAPNTITLGGVPLAVPLLSFGVRQQGTSAIVLWSAPSEAAGLGFDVERSTDGRNFTTIGHVASATESNTTVDYRFEDGNMPSSTAGGKIYYRLRQMAFDGQSDYSKVATLTTAAGFESASTKLSLYPNPASNVLHVSLNGAQGQTATVVLSDATGRMVDSKTTNSEGIATLEVSSLPAGMYFVQYRTENSELIATERIAITR